MEKNEIRPIFHTTHNNQFQVDYEPKSERLSRRAFRDIIEEHWLPRSLQWLWTAANLAFLPYRVPIAPGGSDRREPSWGWEVSFFIIVFAATAAANKKPALQHRGRTLPVGWGRELLLSPSAGRPQQGSEKPCLSQYQRLLYTNPPLFEISQDLSPIEHW